MSLVLDTSVSLAWGFEDEQTPEVMSLAGQVSAEAVFAPQLCAIEALNGRGRDGEVSALVNEKLGRFSLEKLMALLERSMASPFSLPAKRRSAPD